MLAIIAVPAHCRYSFAQQFHTIRRLQESKQAYTLQSHGDAFRTIAIDFNVIFVECTADIHIIQHVICTVRLDVCELKIDAVNLLSFVRQPTRK